VKKALALQIEEIAGNKFPDRDSAQHAAMESLSEDLQAVIRNLLERGVLVKVDGKITPALRASASVSNPTMKS
jgi:hypothetical protein